VAEEQNVKFESNVNPATRAASALYLAAGVVGSVVALTGDYPGIPLGIDLGLTSAQGVWVGWGSGVSAPWPMLAALALTAIAGRGQRWVVPTLGLMFVAGALMEPLSWETVTGSGGRWLAVLVWLNVALPLGLIGTGIRDVQTSGAHGRRSP
jgi:hypothetical protein